MELNLHSPYLSSYVQYNFTFTSSTKMMDLNERMRREFLPDMFVVETQPNMDISSRP